MQDAKPLATPMTLDDNKIYRELLGKLQWLSGSTRPDITFAVNHLSRFVNSQAHWNATKGVLK